MPRRSILVVVSAGQLAAQAVGQAVALRRRLHYDLVPLGWRGSAEHVGRDSWLLGTALSAPAAMLVTQAVATAVLHRRPSAVSAHTLGFLGWAMVGGLLGERVVRRRVLGGEWEPVESPVAALGLAGAGVMAVLGLGTDPR
jgi:hypothetical protein